MFDSPTPRRLGLVLRCLGLRGARDGALGCVALACLIPFAVSARTDVAVPMAAWLAAITVMAALTVLHRAHWIESHLAPRARLQIAGCWLLGASLAPLGMLGARACWVEWRGSPSEADPFVAGVEVLAISLRFAALGLFVSRVCWKAPAAVFLFGAVAFFGPVIASDETGMGRLGALVTPQSLGTALRAPMDGARSVLADMAGACAMLLAAAALPARVRS